MQGDPVPRSTTDELLAQVRDELRDVNEELRAFGQRAERGAGELREPAEAAAKKPAASKPTAKSK